MSEHGYSEAIGVPDMAPRYGNRSRTLIRENEEVKLLARKFSAREREQWHQGIFALYAKMRARSSRGQYELNCGDLTLTVLPNVYAPRIFTDSLWFAHQLPRTVGKGSLLEIGTGTGIIAIECAMRGARAVATDCNPDAVRNTRLNVARHNLEISVRCGNLYDPIAYDEKFDFIFWAHPFNNWETPVEDMLLRSGMDYRYAALRGYFKGARQHLSAQGKLLLGTADSADLKTVSKLAAENGYRIVVINKVNLPFEEDGVKRVTYLLCELIFHS